MSGLSSHCLVTNCKTTIHNKGPGVSFHACPVSREMRNKWLDALKNKCSMIDWSKSKICSKHFKNHCFDSSRRLKNDAVPTLLQSVVSKLIPGDTATLHPKNKFERLLSKKSSTELLYDINKSMAKLQEPENISDLCHDNLQPKSDLTTEEQLWLIIKKQEYLIKVTTNRASEDARHISSLEASVEGLKSWKKKRDENLQNYKYIVKCLQEKHAILEEQIEILTTVESR